MRFFNTEGPVAARKHYCIPPLERLNVAELLALIAQERYFVLHAPRQTGKTSALLALRDLLEADGAGDYRCVYVNVEAAQAVREDVERAMRVILGEMGDSALFQGDGFLDGIWSDVLARFGDRALGAALARWCRADPKPLVLLIDEIDTLIGDTLIAVLRQLRAGYVRRPAAFPQSAWCCAACATCATTASTRALSRRSSPAAAHSTSAPSRCAWGTSPRRRCAPWSTSTLKRRDRRSPRRRWRRCGRRHWASRGWSMRCAPARASGTRRAGPLAGHHLGGGDGGARASRAEPSGPSPTSSPTSSRRSGCAAWSNRC